MALLDVCDQDPPVISPESTVAEAIRQMLEARVGAITVVDSERVVAGIFTERDVMRRVTYKGRDPKTTPVADVMTRPVELATEATTDAEALAVMLTRHYRHLPVVDGKGRLLGMASIRHVLCARVDELLEELQQQRARAARPD
jgi:CBS domain-containing protein